MKRRAERHWSPKQKAHQADYVLSGALGIIKSVLVAPNLFPLSSEARTRLNYSKNELIQAIRTIRIEADLNDSHLP